MSPKSIEIETIVDKSRRAIASAKHELSEGNCDFSCSKSYYAVFYLLEAIMLLEEKSFSKHSGVISAFNHDYVRQGIFPENVSKSIKILLKRRETADYSFSIKVSREDAQECLALASDLFELFTEYLRKKI